MLASAAASLIGRPESILYAGAELLPEKLVSRPPGSPRILFHKSRSSKSPDKLSESSRSLASHRGGSSSRRSRPAPSGEAPSSKARPPLPSGVKASVELSSITPGGPSPACCAASPCEARQRERDHAVTRRFIPLPCFRAESSLRLWSRRAPTCGACSNFLRCRPHGTTPDRTQIVMRSRPLPSLRAT